MMAERPLQVGILCCPRMTQLDLTGPYEVLCRMPDTRVHVLWKDTAPVKTERGLNTRLQAISAWEPFLLESSIGYPLATVRAPPGKMR